MQFLLAVRGCPQDNSIYTPVIPLNVQCAAQNQLGAAAGGRNSTLGGAGALGGMGGMGTLGGVSGLAGLTDAPVGQQGQRKRSSAAAAGGSIIAAAAGAVAAFALL
jgi:hypothetical protein